MIHELEKMIENAGSEDSILKPTEIFNESWLLRIFLQMAKDNPGLSFSNKKSGIVLSHPDGTNFFSEAGLAPPFRKEVQENLYEATTKLDGVIGNFTMKEGSKAKLILDDEAKIFVVLEAKIGSDLSKDVKNAPYYDQAARTVACMAEALKDAKKLPSEIEKLVFALIAPKERIQWRVFEELLSKKSIKTKVKKRISEYDENNRGKLDNWYKEWFKPTLEHIKIVEISWEELIGSILELNSEKGESIKSFYRKCLYYK